MPPKPKLEFVKSSPPPEPPAPSALEAKAFEYAPEAAQFCGTEQLRPIRMGDVLLGFHYNPFGTPPPEYAAVLKHVAETWIIVYRDGVASKYPLVPKHDFKELVPAPSGRRFLVVSKKGPAQDNPDAEVGGGHAVEVDAATLQSTVAITGTTGRAGSFLGSNARDVRELWGVDYVDDDTLVASISENNSTEHSIVLLERGPAGAFVEIDRTKAPKDGYFPKTAAGVVAFSSGNKVVVLGVVERKLVKLGTVDKPAKYGPLVAHPIDRREELWFVDKPAGVHYRLTNHDALLAAAAPKKKK